MVLFRFVSYATNLCAFAALIVTSAYGETRPAGDTNSDPLLQSRDVTTAHRALDDISRRGPSAVPALIAFLRSGPPDELSEHALRVLGDLRAREGRATLQAFALHRRAAVRLLAYDALSKLEDSSVRLDLEQGLRDGDPRVRGAAARLLGERHMAESENVLFEAFARGVPEAGPAIASVGDCESIDRLSEYLEHHPLSWMLAAYRVFLLRQDVVIRCKEKVVERLGKVAGPLVRSFLTELLSSIPERNSLRPTVTRILKRIPSRTQGRRVQPASSSAPPLHPPTDGGIPR